jgi:hypothetical protein
MRADLIARDRDERPVLVVEVKARPTVEDDIRQLLASLDACAADSRSQGILYGMLVDPEQIVIFAQSDYLADPRLGRFGPYSTIEVVRHYDADFAGPEGRRGSLRGFGIYLKGLIEGWLQDLMTPWEEGEPPLKKELAEAGLLKRLEEGTITEERLVRDDSLC